MPEDAQAARFDAFCIVPLFRAFFERLEGHQLPPESGLVNLLKNVFGVDPARAKVVLRILMDSAESAGLFEVAGSRTRMLRPRVRDLQSRKAAEPVTTEPPSRSTIGAPIVKGSGAIPAGVHTAITGILGELPSPDEGWSSNEKQRFLAAFTAILDVVYPTNDSNGGSK